MPKIEYNDTISLMAAMERIKPPASFLLDTFFPNVPPTVTTSVIMTEYRKGGRRLAPVMVLYTVSPKLRCAMSSGEIVRRGPTIGGS